MVCGYADTPDELLLLHSQAKILSAVYQHSEQAKHSEQRPTMPQVLNWLAMPCTMHIFASDPVPDSYTLSAHGYVQHVLCQLYAPLAHAKVKSGGHVTQHLRIALCCFC